MPEIMDDVTVDGTVTATRFIGPLTGTASRASADASGNGISSTYATKTAVAGKQDALVSGTNIKTVNGTSLLGSGDIAVQPPLVSGTNIKTVNGSSILGSGDLTVAAVNKIPAARLIGGVYNDITSAVVKVGFTGAADTNDSSVFENVQASAPYYGIKVKKTGWYFVTGSILGRPETTASGRLQCGIGLDSNLEQRYALTTAANNLTNITCTYSGIIQINAGSVLTLTGWYSAGSFIVTGAAGGTALSVIYLGEA